MRQSLSPLLLLLLFFGCQQDISNNKPVGWSLPAGADAIFSTGNIANSETFLRYLSLFGIENTMSEGVLKSIDTLALEEIALGFYNSDGSPAFVLSGFVQTLHDTLDLEVDKKNFKGITQLGNALYKVSNQDHIFISNDSLLLKKREFTSNYLLDKLNKVERKNQGFNFFTSTTIDLLPLSLIRSSDTDTLTEGSLFLDVNSNNKKLSYYGLIKPDTISQLKLSKPHDSKLLDIIPTAAAQWQLVTIGQSHLNQVEINETIEPLDSIPDFKELSLE
ncbi:MAG: hypothetical protein AAGH46_04885, partial [Bacteroidota bacterium]